MPGRSDRPVLRTALARHLQLTAAVAVVLSGLISVGMWRSAEDEAAQTAGRVARQVAVAVLVPMAEHDYVRPGGFDRGDLLGHVSPFLASGVVERIKVFTVAGDLTRIVFSDEPRVEGQTGRMDPYLGRRLDAGEVVVEPVPEDPQHRYESSLAGTRMEVFFAFRDAGGNDALLELYVPVDVGATTRRAVLVLLPLVLGALVLLAIAMIPLSVALARRIERDRAEQRAVRRYGLAAAELTRRHLAQRLHDGVIPDLAGAGLLLESLRATSPDDRGAGRDQILDRAHDLVVGDVRRLRGLLDELLPPGPPEATLEEALLDLVESVRTAEPHASAPAVDIEVTGLPPLTPETAVLLHRVAGELVRNAYRHAAARTLTITARSTTLGDARAVELTVADDGVGFDVDRSRRVGHIGLQLVRRAVQDGGGRVAVVSEPGAGTTVTVVVPDEPDPRTTRAPGGRWTAIGRRTLRRRHERPPSAERESWHPVGPTR